MIINRVKEQLFTLHLPVYQFFYEKVKGESFYLANFLYMFSNDSAVFRHENC